MSRYWELLTVGPEIKRSFILCPYYYVFSTPQACINRLCLIAFMSLRHQWNMENVVISPYDYVLHTLVWLCRWINLHNLLLYVEYIIVSVRALNKRNIEILPGVKDLCLYAWVPAWWRLINQPTRSPGSNGLLSVADEVVREIGEGSCRGRWLKRLGMRCHCMKVYL